MVSKELKDFLDHRELMVFKDADALDRWRIGDLDPSSLRTESARALLEISYRLWHEARE